MKLGAPWRPTPGRWSLDGNPMRVQVPATIDFVRAVALPDAAGLWTTVVCTHPADHQRIFASLVDRRLDYDVLDQIADELVHRIAGWKRWEAEHVWTKTLAAWPAVDGDMQLSGVDLLGLDAGRATNAAFAWWRRLLAEDRDGWKKFEREMTREPRRVIEAQAAEPMDMAAMSELQANIASARGR